MEELEIPVDKGINSVDDIEYQELCPFNKYAIESLYYVNGDGIISYYDGRQAPSYSLEADSVGREQFAIFAEALHEIDGLDRGLRLVDTR